MAFGFFDPQKGQSATGIAQSRAMAAALLRSGGAPRNVGEGLNAIGDAIFYRSLIGNADASEKAGTDAFNSQFNSLIAPYTGGQASTVPMPTAAGEVASTAPGSDPIAEVLAAGGNPVPGDASSWLRYDNGGATRSHPLNQKLVSALGFLPEMGVTMDVFSGGQPSASEGGARTGSDRHDHGNAADVFFSKNGKRLDWANPDDVPVFQDIVRRGKAAGITGFGAGDGYMQPGSMHLGFGNNAVWGAGGKGANAPDWLRTAYNSPGNNQVASASPVTATDAIASVAPQALAPELPAPTTVAAAPAVAEVAPIAAPQQVAQNFQPQQIDPRLIEAANSPFATPGQKAILGGIIQQQQQRNQLILKQQMEQADPAYQIDLDTKKIQLQNLRNKTSEDTFTNVGDGYLFNNRTKEFIRAPQNVDVGGNLFQGNALDAQALNKLVANGSITQEQALNIAAGKVAPDPTTGALTFFPASALVGGGAQQSQEQPYIDLFGNGGNAPQQQTQQNGNGSVTLTGNRAPTEGQANAAGFSDRMINANNTIANLESEGTDKEQAVRNSIPLIGNYLTSEGFQSYDRAKRDFINAQLRRESGAAIGRDEYASADKQYFPQPGDSAQVLKDKAQARALAIQAMTRSAGPSYSAPKQEVVSDDIRAAREAIKAGAPRDKVIERLQAAGIDTTGL